MASQVQTDVKADALASIQLRQLQLLELLLQLLLTGFSGSDSGWQSLLASHQLLPRVHAGKCSSPGEPGDSWIKGDSTRIQCRAFTVTHGLDQLQLERELWDWDRGMGLWRWRCRTGLVWVTSGWRFGPEKGHCLRSLLLLQFIVYFSRVSVLCEN